MSRSAAHLAWRQQRLCMGSAAQLARQQQWLFTGSVAQLAWQQQRLSTAAAATSPPPPSPALLELQSLQRESMEDLDSLGWLDADGDLIEPEVRRIAALPLACSDNSVPSAAQLRHGITRPIMRRLDCS